MRFLANIARKPFQDPLKALTLGIVAAVVLLPIMGSVVWGMYAALSRIGVHEVRLQKLSATVSYLNEALSNSARMAAAILFGEEYDRYKALYSRGLNDMTSNVQARIASELRRFRTRMWGTGVLGLLSLTLLVSTWTGISMVVKAHVKRSKRAEEALANERELFLVT
jgi:hypothetical protein